MIFSRTPLRLTLGGGGTDLPSFYETEGPGHLISVTINKYIYVAAHPHFERQFSLKYSGIEVVDNIDDIVHPLLRECLREVNIPPGIEVASLADVPGGTGLGSSGAFTVGVLNALYAFKGTPISQRELAEKACLIEMEKLNEPVGKQDQYAAAFGGLSEFQFHSDGSVDYRRLQVSEEYRSDLEDRLVLFFTGIQRNAADELAATSSPNPSESSSLIRNLREIRDTGRQSANALVSGRLDDFGDLLNLQWHLKLSRSRSSVHARVDEWIRSGIKHGAIGGKLIGAGGGGFILFYTHDAPSVRSRMKAEGLREVRFKFDEIGTTLIPW